MYTQFYANKKNKKKIVLLAYILPKLVTDSDKDRTFEVDLFIQIWCSVVTVVDVCESAKHAVH